jgi:hypothetical protein
LSRFEAADPFRAARQCAAVNRLREVTAACAWLQDGP